MSQLNTARNNVARVQREMADLRSKDAQEARKEADLTQKLARATRDAHAAKSPNTLTSKLRDAERASNEIANVQKRRADLAKKIASKTSDLNRYQQDVAREEERDRKRLATEAKRLEDARARQIKQLEQRLQDHQEIIGSSTQVVSAEDNAQLSYDVFISHASEDKESFVRALADRLTQCGLTVWYDDTTLKWGDSLRREIDKGLARSRFGVVVLSESFFRKEWPQRELDGLVQLETAGRSRILPIWHKVSKDEVAAFSPTLADKVALNTAVMTLDEIVAELRLLSGVEA
ncbi:small-conductance mechanosensitive channel [Sphingobium sp. OAS761]|uniref:toll/interleukin-1 receptor domain-containing protein n=1 Tax=Sphingobium sp. OAS761 TaxID=2817901 RepID=UPI00209FD25E|nr:toll/interleukin-1 receptor domain-containing protein [Sphingobium sp. OAS761]MCP1471661.1 small-conductance mechanosensitive channel [Sphingobium sp. OAS761]